MTTTWKTPTVLIVVLAALLTGAGVAVAVVQLSGNDSPEAQIATCREAHDAPQEPRSSDYSSGTWTDCAWPAPRGAGSDGFGEVTVSRVDNDAETTAAYEGADIFETTCRTLSLTYRHERQGVITSSKVLTEDVGQVLALDTRGADDTELRLQSVALPTFIDKEASEIADGQLIIAVPFAYQVSEVACS